MTAGLSEIASLTINTVLTYELMNQQHLVLQDTAITIISTQVTHNHTDAGSYLVSELLVVHPTSNSTVKTLTTETKQK